MVVLRQLLLLLVEEEVLVLGRVHRRGLVMAHHLLLRLLPHIRDVSVGRKIAPTGRQHALDGPSI